MVTGRGESCPRGSPDVLRLRFPRRRRAGVAPQGKRTMSITKFQIQQLLHNLTALGDEVCAFGWRPNRDKDLEASRHANLLLDFVATCKDLGCDVNATLK